MGLPAARPIPSSGAADVLPPRLNNLQALRIIAAVAVVVFHLAPHYAAMGGSWTPLLNWAKWGYSGVDVFFVVSGFVMLYSTRTSPTGPVAATDFFRRRLLRVFVGYLPFLLLRYVVLARYAEDRLADMSITKSVLLISTDLEELVLGISWTLTFELYFYLLFGLTMLLPRRLLLRAWLFIGVGIGLPYVIGAQFSGWPKTAFSPLVLEFVAGVVLAATIRWWCRQHFVPIFAATAVIGWMVGVGMDGDPSRFRASTFGVGSVGLLGLVILLEQRGWAVGRWMSAAGDASYAVYLAHISFLTLFFTWGIRSWFAELSLLGPEVGVLSFVVFTVLFSMAWFQLIERRSYRATLRWTQSPPRQKHHPTPEQKSAEVGETIRH